MSSSFESFLQNSLLTQPSSVQFGAPRVFREVMRLLLLFICDSFSCHGNTEKLLAHFQLFFSLHSREDQSLFEYLAQNHDVSNRTRSYNPMSCPGMSLL